MTLSVFDAFRLVSHVICAHDRVWLARMVFGQL